MTLNRDGSKYQAKQTKQQTKRIQGFRNSVSRWLLAGLIAGTTTLTGIGCSRSYYRKTVDAETSCIIEGKINAAHIDVPLNVRVDRASRMFDPFNPDRPPMPEDDPVAHTYMQRVDGKKHYPLWDVNGRTNTVESIDWWQMLPLDERGVLVLDSNSAVQLAILHSPQYQSQVETLYLSAVDVSSERFLLDNQFFGGWGIDYTADGPDRRGGGGTSRSELSTGPFSRARRPFSWQRRFASGTDMVVGFANSLTWNFSGPNTQSASTVLDFSIIQPLLRGGGRDVVLERLTLAERTLLANVRAFERYRTGFYINVTAGRGNEPGPNRRGGLFGGAGLEGFTGLGGGFGAVGGTVQARGIGAAGAAGGFGGGGGVANVGGILGLIQTELQIRNAEENIARLQDNLLRFDDNLREQLLKIPPTQDTIPSQQLQVAQARQALVSAQAQLLSTRNNYEQTLDQFKQTLGLPPYICVEIRDPILDQFNLISPNMLERRGEVAELREIVGQQNTTLLELTETRRDEVSGEVYRVIDFSQRTREALQGIAMSVEAINEVRNLVEEFDIPDLRRDIQKLRESIPERIDQSKRLREIYETEKEMICTLLPVGGIDTALLSTTGLEALADLLDSELDKLESNIRSYRNRINQLANDVSTVRRDESINAIPGANQGAASEDSLARRRFESIRDGAVLQSQSMLSDLADDILALQVLQARARTESVLLPEIDISPRDAVDIARRYRLDWMNNRAALVDSWRAIEVVADELESYLDVVISGDMQNGNNNPLSLQGKTGRLRAGLQWDSPLTRIQERNRYRQVLIEYQQAKRSFYQYEDSVWATLRALLRNVRFLQYNFELQRYAVRIAAEQITLNEDIRQIRESLSQASGPTAARDSVSALNDLLNAQNTFLNVWVFYEGQRRALDQDLGTIQVDNEGIWIDPGRISAERYLFPTQSPFPAQEVNLAPTPFDLPPVFIDRGEVL